MAFYCTVDRVAWREKLKIFLVVQIPVTVVIALVIFAGYSFESEKKMAVVMAYERQRLNHQQELLSSVFQTVVSDLMFLAETLDVSLYLQSDNPGQAKDLSLNWLALCKRKRLYDQIRYLDASGMEIVRINYNNGNPSIVEVRLLQNKAKRYYFQDTFRLDSGEVYVSPLDLNIEQDKIEEPRKPMIRFGMPVFDRQGVKCGIIMLNYLGEHLITLLKRSVAEQEGVPMLLNADGYWLMGTEEAKEWGFMYGKELTFGKDYPQAWEVISAQESGQIQSDQGLFTFATIYPLVEGMKSSTGAPHAFEQSKRQVEVKAYYWKCLSFIPLATLTQANAYLRKGAVLLFILFFAATSLLSLLVAGLLIKRRQAEKRVMEERELAQTYLGIAGVMMVALDVQGKVTLVNRKGCEILGYGEEEIIGKEWFGSFLPDGIRAEMRGVFHQLMTGDIEPVEYYENLVVANDQTEKMIAFHNTLLKDRQGNITGVLFSGEDITERRMAQESLRLSEEKFRIVADNTYDWEFWIGSDNRFIYTSPSCRKITGYCAEDFAKSPDLLHRLIHPDDLATFQRHRHGAREMNVIEEIEFRIIRPDGSMRWIAHACQPVFDSEGRFIGTRGNNRDITLRKQVEEEKGELIGELQKALAQVKQLSGLLPICASCKKIRDDKGCWTQIESYIHSHSEAEFSHGMCPECLKKLYPEYYPSDAAST